LKEVAGCLLRELTTKKSEKSAAKKSGREYWLCPYVELST
jgi:hypothetical protein